MKYHCVFAFNSTHCHILFHKVKNGYFLIRPTYFKRFRSHYREKQTQSLPRILPMLPKTSSNDEEMMNWPSTQFISQNELNRSPWVICHEQTTQSWFGLLIISNLFQWHRSATQFNFKKTSVEPVMNLCYV